MLEVKPAKLSFKDLMLEEFCNSHCVSHLAAFFIVMGAKISTVENFLLNFRKLVKTLFDKK